MLQHFEHEGVHFWKVARSYFGQMIYTTGFYLLDDVLIDCGPPNARSLLTDLFRQLPSRRLLITHHHEDHTGNAAFLARDHGYSVAGHSAGPGELQHVSRGIPFYRKTVWGVPEALSYQPVGPAEETQKRQLQSIETRGHSPDHLCFYVPEKGWLFTGDLYLSGYLRYLRRDEDIYELMRSLRRLIQLKPRILFCNHRGPVPDGEAALGRKLSYLENLRDSVMDGIDRGMTLQDLARSLMKKDVFFSRFSGGEFSSLNLIRALAEGEKAVADAG